jgi:hypothetical protein
MSRASPVQSLAELIILHTYVFRYDHVLWEGIPCRSTTYFPQRWRSLVCCVRGARKLFTLLCDGDFLTRVVAHGAQLQ